MFGVWVWGNVPKIADSDRHAKFEKIPYVQCDQPEYHSSHVYFMESIGKLNYCKGLKSEPPAFYACQVIYPEIANVFPCQFQEGGGKVCENFEPHTDDHKWSRHTIAHEQGGNGYSCGDIEQIMKERS